MIYNFFFLNVSGKSQSHSRTNSNKDADICFFHMGAIVKVCESACCVIYLVRV